MRTADGDRIGSVIRARRGRAQAITTYQICRELGWPPARERAVRHIIADESMLWPGILVCCAEGEGYFCAATCDEAIACETWLRELRDHAQMTLDAFIGQCRRLGLHPAPADDFSRGVRDGIAEILTTH